ncbi:disease resistance protein RUN1-like isoform X1 [Vicia villosa]|uniref:disease resistance protein RUN1-like isoform X1 n=2 Tax=Vicia villosa TaxID=3911 RepID=UPI00273CCD3A|nr:disease resistance protein RUN1-like isoform X1 [Vicia villosa]
MEWNEIHTTPFRSAPSVFKLSKQRNIILFHSVLLRSIRFHQSKQSLREKNTDASFTSILHESIQQLGSLISELTSSLQEDVDREIHSHENFMSLIRKRACASPDFESLISEYTPATTTSLLHASLQKLESLISHLTASLKKVRFDVNTEIREHEVLLAKITCLSFTSHFHECILYLESLISELTSSFQVEGIDVNRVINEHEVFLSFRGDDTRASFTSHLHASLQNDGISVFMDDDSLQRGNHISASLLRAIENSQISVIVFSRNYADSRWCLEELVKIIQCRRTVGKVVLPVFYGVDPSEVRHQTGEFGQAFQRLLNRTSKDKKYKSLKWRKALREAAGLAGFVVLNSRNEREAINDIVEKVTLLLDKTQLFVADNPVGVESRVKDIIQQLDIQQSNNVLLLGMWGMGGTGKTTIAKAIYNKIGRNFEGRSFLVNIRETWEGTTGKVSLQERLLLDIFKETKTKIQSIESGKTTLKDRLCNKRVLLILDDVNILDQLKALCGSREWFGSGSRIIITTRDKHILRGIRVDKVYTMKEMDENESIEFFSLNAFKQPSPRKQFAEISRKIVEYCGGLPLALEVLGSYLFDRGLTDWKCVLEKIKIIPNDQVQQKLKISYDGLNDDTEKEIFLDIACFFIGMDRNDVIQILNPCGLFAEIGISVLVERSLITVDDKNKLRMHDLLRDMGREIIREKSPKEPEERSILWFREDVLGVLFDQNGTKAVEGLALKLPIANSKCFSTKAFKKMKRLRLLQLVGVQLDGDFEYLSRNLRWLCWNGFPLTCIPSNFYQGNLVSMELENSNMKFVWKETPRMEMLKILNLSHSHQLMQTPNFSNLPNLEKLILVDCPMLSEVSNSIGDLNKILLINLEDCICLCNLPRSIYKLTSLKTLILSGCLMIDTLEEDIEKMESLTTLIANNTGITRVPFSIVRSKSIGYISLCGYEGFSRDVFPAIISSWISPTNNFTPQFQTSTIMSSLISLDVPHSSSQELSSISKYLPSLRSLWVECSSEDQLSHDTTIILEALYALNSRELEPTSSTSQVSKNSFKSLFIQLGRNCQVANILKEKVLQYMSGDESGGCVLLGDSYPDWLSFNCDGSAVIFKVPQVEGRNLKSLICIAYSSTPDNITSDGLKNVLVKNYTKATIQLYRKETLASFTDEEGERVVSSIEPRDKVEVVVVFENGFSVKKTTVYLVYDEPMGEKSEQWEAPEQNTIACRADENESVQCEEPDENANAYSADENESILRTSSPQVELVEKNVGASSCGSVKYSFRQWITNFMCRLVECWG